MDDIFDNVRIGDIKDFVTSLNLTAFSRIFVLSDRNTSRYCVPAFLEKTKLEVAQIVIPEGESNKSLETCIRVWDALLKGKADRQSLLINVGGGVVGDLGAFCASTYMRGIAHIQVPTSLLAQVDASIGGKSGVDFQFYKNIIGTFTHAKAIYVDPQFLETLPTRHLKNGFVEVLKHALIADRPLWNMLMNGALPAPNELHSIIERSIAIKQNIVRQDPLESSIRKALNFGHTIGHAVEYTALSQGQDLLHGEAVAFGIMVAVRISAELSGFPQDQIPLVDTVMKQYCGITPDPLQVDTYIETALTDKKNKNQELRFTLLREIGQFEVDVPVEADMAKRCILQSIDSIENRAVYASK